MELNTQQREAVVHKSGPLLIIAGAGTGKTKVLTERIAHIINEKWAKPEEILALTFTEKAANEMEERVQSVLPISYEQPTISTFHAFADQILKEDAVYLGLDSNYTLMTQAESYILFRRHLYEMPLEKFRPLGNPAKFISDILSHFSRLQDEDISPKDYIDFATQLSETDDVEKEKKLEAKELSQTYKKYSEIKVVNSKLDFGDLIITVLNLFRSKPNILDKYHKKYKYILVDEYQDTNFTQNVMVNMLALGKEVAKAESNDRSLANITVVGDDDQSIYKFRGAAISNILQFKDLYPFAKSVVLTKNYRSQQEILDASYRLIKNNDPHRLEVTEKIDKRLVSSITEQIQNSVSFIHTTTSSFEADRIVEEIKTLVGESSELNTEFNVEGQATFTPNNKVYRFNDIAILARANSHLDEIVKTLRFNGIPFKLGGARSLYARPEISILISFLKVVVDYSDEVSMFNILSMEEWGLTPRDLVEIMRIARSKNLTTFESMEAVLEMKDKLSDVAIESIKKLTEILNSCFDMQKDGRGAGEILFSFFEKSGMKDKYLKQEDGKYQFVVDNIKKYFDMINKFWVNNPNTNIYEYLDYLNYSIEVGESPTIDSDLFDEVDAVNLLTIHSSKGLEFPVVFVINMVSDRFPSRNRSDAIPIPNGLIKELLTEGDSGVEHLMEERRLAYVAFTRAKEKLYITAADLYSEGKRKKKLSPFIYECLNKDIVNEKAQVDKNAKEIIIKEGKDLLVYENLGLKVSNEFSFTQINKYIQCPKAYKYEYIFKIPTKPNSALSFGSTVHNTLKHLYEQLKASKSGLEGLITPLTLEEVLENYSKNWIDLGYDSKKHMLERFESGKDMFKDYFKNVYSIKESPLFLEKSFKMGIEDYILIGRIDRIDLIETVDGEKWVEIIDYKTGKAKTTKDLKDDMQLPLYAYIVEKTMALKVKKASYLYIEHGVKTEVEIGMKKTEQILKLINEAVQKIRDGDFTVPAGHDCRFCNYKDICDESII
jgi:DNA helicase-2/ATP-dependent DNA helicase PcrA